MKLIFETYTPAEAAAVSGVSNAHQIAGRKAGVFVNTGSGHMKWDIRGLARLGAFKCLSDRGLGPKAAAPYLDDIEDAIFRHMLLFDSVYSADAIREAELVWDTYVDKAHDNPGPDRRGDLLRRHAIKYLFSQVVGELEDLSLYETPEGVMPFMVIWPDGEMTPEDWEGMKLIHGLAPAKRRGAILLLTVSDIAESLCEALPRPLIGISKGE